jgi:ESCRT-I complex subunit TSG101
MSAMQDSLKSNIGLLQTSMSNADSTISSARRRSSAGDIPKVDDMLVPPYVVGKQLYDTVAEERGLEAAILALQDAFVRGRIGSDIWSRKTRELAREGFRKKYLTKKIGAGMGLEV